MTSTPQTLQLDDHFFAQLARAESIMTFVAVGERGVPIWDMPGCRSQPAAWNCKAVGPS